jgi:hypothetical protein
MSFLTGVLNSVVPVMLMPLRFNLDGDNDATVNNEATGCSRRRNDAQRPGRL